MQHKEQGRGFKIKKAIKLVFVVIHMKHHATTLSKMTL